MPGLHLATSLSNDTWIKPLPVSHLNAICPSGTLAIVGRSFEISVKSTFQSVDSGTYNTHSGVKLSLSVPGHDHDQAWHTPVTMWAAGPVTHSYLLPTMLQACGSLVYSPKQKLKDFLLKSLKTHTHTHTHTHAPFVWNFSVTKFNICPVWHISVLLQITVQSSYMQLLSSNWRHNKLKSIILIGLPINRRAGAHTLSQCWQRS